MGLRVVTMVPLQIPQLSIHILNTKILEQIKYNAASAGFVNFEK